MLAVNTPKATKQGLVGIEPTGLFDWRLPQKAIHAERGENGNEHGGGRQPPGFRELQSVHDGVVEIPSTAHRVVG